MDGAAVRHASRPFPYRATTPAGLRLAAAVLAIACAASGGGCAMSSALFGGTEASDSARAEVTGSIARGHAKPKGGAVEQSAPPDSDLAYAKAAAAEILARDGKDTSATWENPRTGARGTVTPIAAAGGTSAKGCREFLASYVKGQTQSWLQGEACQGAPGRWEVRSLKPWTRS